MKLTKYSIWFLVTLTFFTSNLIFAKETYKLKTAELAGLGETFNGMVVEVTDSGEVPLGKGDQVSFQGKVVPVQEGGRIKIPPIFKEAGNFFLVGQITRASSKLGKGEPPPTTTPQHVEIIPVSQGGAADSIRIAHASDIVTSTSQIRVAGNNLNKLKEAILVGKQDTVTLKNVAGSSLQQIYETSKGENFSKGEYQFVGIDSYGHKFEAPNQSKNPQLSDVSGTEITHVGQKGKIRFRSNTNTYVKLDVEPPLIEPKEPVVYAPENKTTTVEFISREVGNYTVDLKCMNAEDIPDSLKKSRVDSKPQSIETRYDPKKDSTFITAPVQIVDEKGKAVKDVPVDGVVSGPGGVQFSRASTNRQGIAKFISSFPGQVASSAVTASVYRVLEHAWKEPPSTPPTVSTDEPPPLTTPQDKPCQLRWKCKYVYSRGNNDENQLKQQKDKTGKFQYQTCKIELEFSITADCECRKGTGPPEMLQQDECHGDAELKLKFTVSELPEEWKVEGGKYALMCGPSPGDGCASEIDRGTKAPGPDLKFRFDATEMPKAKDAKPENKLKKPKMGSAQWEAEAICKISCKAGEYRNRFYLVPLNSNFFIDAIVKISDENCKLAVDFKHYMIEFLSDSKLSGHGDELNELDHRGPDPGTASSMVRLIEEECEKTGKKKIADPFPKKHKDVTKQ